MTSTPEERKQKQDRLDEIQSVTHLLESILKEHPEASVGSVLTRAMPSGSDLCSISDTELSDALMEWWKRH